MPHVRLAPLALVSAAVIAFAPAIRAQDSAVVVQLRALIEATQRQNESLASRIATLDTTRVRSQDQELRNLARRLQIIETLSRNHYENNLNGLRTQYGVATTRLHETIVALGHLKERNLHAAVIKDLAALANPMSYPPFAESVRKLFPALNRDGNEGLRDTVGVFAPLERVRRLASSTPITAALFSVVTLFAARGMDAAEKRLSRSTVLCTINLTINAHAALTPIFRRLDEFEASVDRLDTEARSVFATHVSLVGLPGGYPAFVSRRNEDANEFDSLTARAFVAMTRDSASRLQLLAGIVPSNLRTIRSSLSRARSVLDDYERLLFMNRDIMSEMSALRAEAGPTCPIAQSAATLQRTLTNSLQALRDQFEAAYVAQLPSRAVRDALVLTF